jgi:hypothetical protein
MAMSLLTTIKKLVYLAPVRCGRTFYAVDILQTADKINIKFTPTDKFLMIDPRREDEEFMPEHVHIFEKWQHMGLAIGSLEYFLTENNINFDLTQTDTLCEISVDRVEKDFYIGIDKQERLKHAHRTFNPDLAVDIETLALIENKIDQFLSKNAGHKILVTDKVLRKKLHALAIYWESIGDVNSCVRPPQMATTPMMISVPPVEYDINYWFNMGRLYADLGLTALAQGYQVAYCNAFNLFDPRVARLEDVLHVKFGTYTKENFVPRPWICIGKALDPNKPYNWVGIPNRYSNDIMITCILTTKEYVTVEMVDA